MTILLTILVIWIAASFALGALWARAGWLRNKRMGRP